MEKIREPDKKYRQFRAVDDRTRLRVLKVYERNSQQNAIRFVDEALFRLAFRAEVVETDNGSEFGSQFHFHLLDRGIGYVYIRPQRPSLNGKIERSHRIDKEEFSRLLDEVLMDNTNLFSEKVGKRENFYNHTRPHAALNGQTPYGRFRERIGLCA